MQSQMVPPNEEFDPTEECEQVLDLFKEGRDEGRPWGRANPRYIIDETGLEKPNVEYHLRRLTDAGWIRKIARGQYEFVGDPREDDQHDGVRSDGAGAGTIVPEADPIDALLEDVVDEDEPYAEANALAIELVRRSEQHLQASELQAAVADQLPDRITPASWWERHGRDAIEDAGAENHKGAGWLIDE